MRIITISREFGSGGREPGKRLADTLGFDYYGRESIIRCVHLVACMDIEHAVVFGTVQTSCVKGNGGVFAAEGGDA